MAPLPTPTRTVDPRYTSPGADCITWEGARQLVADAELYWLSTVRPDGRLHVTPLVGVVEGDALVICTGPEEQKARNLAASSRCALTTGCNRWAEGTDVVWEGPAARVTDPGRLRRVADAFLAKYGEAWRFEPVEGGFAHEGHAAHVLAVTPTTVHAFGKDPHSQTRWTF